jgi:hypothetical protein
LPASFAWAALVGRQIVIEGCPVSDAARDALRELR